MHVREWEWEGMGKALWESDGNGNWLQNWEWEWEGMGIDCTGMGGSGNVKSHSRASLLGSYVRRIANSEIYGVTLVALNLWYVFVHECQKNLCQGPTFYRTEPNRV